MPKKGQFDSLKDRLYRHFIPEPNSGCWLWDGKTDRDGYGTMTRNDGPGTDYKVHRVSYEVHKGPIPAGLDVCHSCDVRACINPEHLSVGTRSKNIAERTARKREPRGVQCSWSKVNEDVVREIRQPTRHWDSYRAMARHFGISFAQVSRIKNGVCWK